MTLQIFCSTTPRLRSLITVHVTTDKCFTKVASGSRNYYSYRPEQWLPARLWPAVPSQLCSPGSGVVTPYSLFTNQSKDYKVEMKEISSIFFEFHYAFLLTPLYLTFDKSIKSLKVFLCCVHCPRRSQQLDINI